MWPECNLGNLEVKNCHFVGVLQLSFFHEWKNCAGKGRKMPRWPFPDTVELALLERDSVKWPVLPSEVAFLYMLCIDTKFRFFPSRQRHLASRKGAFLWRRREHTWYHHGQQYFYMTPTQFSLLFLSSLSWQKKCGTVGVAWRNVEFPSPPPKKIPLGKEFPLLN